MICVGIERDNYKTVDWLALLDYKATDIWIAIGTLQIPSREFIFRKLLTMDTFLMNSICENRRKYTAFKEIDEVTLRKPNFSTLLHIGRKTGKGRDEWLETPSERLKSQEIFNGHISILTH
jgi:hypothetical protein